MATPSLSPAERLSVAATVVSKWAKKRAIRKVLKDGATYAVGLVVTGFIGRGKINEVIKGELVVGMPQKRADATAVDPAELLAAVAAAIPKRKRENIFNALLAEFRLTKTLGPIDNVELAAAQGLIDQLRDVGEKEVAGNVRFNSEEGGDDDDA